MSSLVASLAIVFIGKFMLEIGSFESLGFVLVPSSGGLDFLLFGLQGFLSFVSLSDFHHLF